MELWDAYNLKFEKIEGLTLIREEEDKIPEGVYHLVNHILVKHTDGTYLLMKRDSTKPAYPNMWEATAGVVLRCREKVLLKARSGNCVKKLEL